MPARPRDRRGSPPARTVPELALCGRIWMGGKLQTAEIGLNDQGEIVQVAKDLRAHRRHDLGQSVILPAAVDLHVHFRDPGRPGDVENLASGTLQAAFGGVGAVGDMPNTDPPVLTVDDVETKAARAKGKAAVDLFIYALLSERTAVERVSRVAGAFKLYMSPTTGVERPPSGPTLGELLRRVAATGAALTVHAEDPRAFRNERSADNGENWDAARPIDSEEHAIESLAGAPPALRLHFAHTTNERALSRVRELGWSCEVTPQHLLLPAESARDPQRKVNPPLRPRAEQEALWRRFCGGEVTSFASDHAPHALADKRLRWADAPSGMPGVETALPLLLARVRATELSLGVLVASACDHPARWMGLPVGRVAPGHRGNLIVVDFKRLDRVHADRLHAPCGWTAFEGFPAVFPVEHYHEGSLIVDHGEYVGNTAGRVVRPEYAPGGSASPVVESG